MLIRADGDAQIGTGHVMRMLALAQHAAATGASVTLASARLSEALATRAAALGVQVVHRPELEPGSADDARFVLSLHGEQPDGWVWVDGYPFDHRYQDALVDAGARCLWVDDYGHSEHYRCALVLNQNLSAREALYARRAAHTRLLLGPSYALLRPEFVAHGRRAPRVPGRADRVLVTLGGSDPVNATARVAQALSSIDDPALEARVLVGPSNPRAAELCAQFSDPRLEWLHGCDDMPALMGWAELAVAAAGSTTYELCYLGVPSLLMVLADNQREVCEAAERHGVARSLGWHHQLEPDAIVQHIQALRADADARAELSRAAQRVVDGQGPGRILQALGMARSAAP